MQTSDYEWFILNVGLVAFAALAIGFFVLVSSKHDLFSDLIKFTYLALWFAVTPGMFIYVALCVNPQKHVFENFCVVIMGLASALPWYFIAWPEVRQRFRRKPVSQ